MRSCAWLEDRLCTSEGACGVLEGSFPGVVVVSRCGWSGDEKVVVTKVVGKEGAEDGVIGREYLRMFVSHMFTKRGSELR